MANIYDISEFNLDNIVDYIETSLGGADGYIVKIGEDVNGIVEVDPKFEMYVNKIKSYKKPFGVYFVNHFGSNEDAVNEAHFINDTLYSVLGDDQELFTMGVWADLEVPKVLTSDSAEYVDTFINELHEMGYKEPIGIYASYSYFKAYLDLDKLANDATPIWVAQYNRTNDLESEYPNLNMKIWQYTTNGETLDQDVWYDG